MAKVFGEGRRPKVGSWLASPLPQTHTIRLPFCSGHLGARPFVLIAAKAGGQWRREIRECAAGPAPIAPNGSWPLLGHPCSSYPALPSSASFALPFPCELFVEFAWQFTQNRRRVPSGGQWLKLPSPIGPRPIPCSRCEETSSGKAHKNCLLFAPFCRVTHITLENLHISVGHQQNSSHSQKPPMQPVQPTMFIFFSILFLAALATASKAAASSSDVSRPKGSAAIIGTERELLQASRPRFRRALDMLEGDDFIGMQRKRALDVLDGDDFMGLKRKRALDILEGEDFMGLKRKRALDMLEGDGFIGMQKRSSGVQRALDRMNWQQQQMVRARRALDALEGNAFGF